MNKSCISGIGQHADGRTPSAGTRKRRGLVVLEGSTGGITCTVTIGPHGEVDLLLEGLPERLVGTKPFLSFPAAASAAGIAWAPGPRAAIVHVGEKVPAAGSVRCRIARSRSRINELPDLLGRIRLMSEEGKPQPRCTIEIGLSPRNR